MGTKTFSFEFTSPVPAARLFKASVLDITDLVPKIIPDVISAASILEGDGGVGTIKQFKFTDALPFTHVNERVDLLDTKNFELKYSVTDGADMGTKLASTVYHVKFVPAGNGSVCKVTAEYQSNAGLDYPDDSLNEAKEGVLRMYKSIEAHLINNPAAYA